MLTASGGAELPIAQFQCRAAAGSYALSRTNLRVRVTGAGRANSRPDVALATETVADRSPMFCLDVLARFRPEPQVRRTADGLLVRIDNEARLPSFKRATATVTGLARRTHRSHRLAEAMHDGMLDLLFDPFDPGMAAKAGVALRAHGLCIAIASYSFDAPSEAGDYCNDPLPFLRRAAAGVRPDDAAAALAAAGRSIIYRPRQPFDIRVYSKDGGRAGWRLHTTRTFMFENISPLMSLGIGELLAQPGVVLTFDRGVLRDIATDKSSAAVAIPFEVVKSIVSLPSAIVQTALRGGSNADAVIKAQQQLLDAHKRFLKEPSAPGPLPAR